MISFRKTTSIQNPKKCKKKKTKITYNLPLHLVPVYRMF